MEDKISINGILFKHGEDDYGLFADFSLTEEEQDTICQILMKHDTEGFSVRGTLKEIAKELVL